MFRCHFFTFVTLWNENLTFKYFDITKKIGRSKKIRIRLILSCSIFFSFTILDWSFSDLLILIWTMITKCNHLFLNFSLFLASHVIQWQIIFKKLSQLLWIIYTWPPYCTKRILKNCNPVMPFKKNFFISLS